MLLEHYAGCLPLWLAPVQAALLSVGERHAEHVETAARALRERGLRVDADTSADKVGIKIRKHLCEERVQLVAVAGDKELESGGFSVRHREAGDLGAMSVEALAAEIEKRVAART